MSTGDGNFAALLVYVDDIVIGSTSDQLVDNIKEYLSTQFKLKDLGIVKYFLGLEIARSPERISVCQRKYVLDMLEEYSLLGAKPVSTPMDYNYKLQKSTKDYRLKDLTIYRQLVGKLLYLTFTRPDVCYAVQVLSQFMDKPSNDHLATAFRVLRYLKGAPGQGLLLHSQSNLQIQAYSDSDWASCPNTRKSVTGYALFLENSMVSWKAKKQSVVARSSVEAEYRSMATTSCEIIWLKSLLAEFGICQTNAIKLYCDNQFAIYISKNPMFH
ncbi:PREDICTED: uncharacterized mitochondrial protein AtMg00810-like [Theobroma cacao]|uniref:Uncharacterized mitochondrial protein AtMg00810-like n=1 Tax=Theobroma cacao TaxID=3641 RepID=A0AB32WXL8_THECC|nr:PREDICTED: uncharacterized mitochondrial protein AtMg00810-like [Theobroma cacao]